MNEQELLNKKKIELAQLEQELKEANFLFGKKSQDFFEKNTREINTLSDKIISTKRCIRDAEKKLERKLDSND